MKRIALFVFNGDPMCFIHVLLNAKAWNDHGHEVKIIIEGTATTLVPEVAKEDNPLHKLWETCRKDGLVAGACRACSQKLGVVDGIKSQDLDLLDGIAGHPSMVQYQEEMAHAMKLYDYIHYHGNKVTIMAIDQPQTEYESLLAICEKTLSHEKFVTRLINELVDLAKSENDTNTESFLQWYVKEQVEEEESAQNLVNKVKSAGNNREALSAIDTEMAGRVFRPPA